MGKKFSSFISTYRQVEDDQKSTSLSSRCYSGIRHVGYFLSLTNTVFISFC